MTEVPDVKRAVLKEAYDAVASELRELGIDEQVIARELSKQFDGLELDEIGCETALQLAEEVKKLGGGLLAGSPEENYKKLIEAFLKDSPTYYDTASGLLWAWDRHLCKWNICQDVDILRTFMNRYGILQWLQPAIETRMMNALKVMAEKKPAVLAPEWVQFKDELVNIVTDEKMRATPALFCTNPLPWALGMTEDTPTIDRLFVEWVGEEHKQKLYELCAYSLYRGYPLHRMFFLIGVGRNGKGTFFSMLSKFVGLENCTSTDLATLISSRFESSRLLNKLVCGISELNVGIFRDTVLLKRLVGGDLLRGEFKGKALFDFHNYAKVVILTNTLPETSDKSDGWYSRYIQVEFPNQFDVGMDRDVLTEVPDAEFEALAAKSVRILRELLKTRIFTDEGNIEEKREKYENKADLLNRFLDEKYEPSAADEVPKFEFQEEFEAWCREKNVMAWSATAVNRALREGGFEVRKQNFLDETTGEQKSWWFVIGLRRKNNPDNPNNPTTPTQIHIQGLRVGEVGLSGYTD